MPEPLINDNTALHRFEMQQDGETAFLLYTRSGNSIRLIHTEVPAALQGKGVASKLVGGVLRILQASGLAVTPSCPFVAEYVKRHPEYLPIIDADHRWMVESNT
jgi:predicted GNAT family acetyltransferase